MKTNIHDSENSSTSNSFEEELENLCRSLQQFSISKNVVENCIKEVFPENANTSNVVRKPLFNVLLSWVWCSFSLLFTVVRICLQVGFILTLLYLVATSHNVTQKFIMRNSQSFIYPFMRFVRLWTLPIIQTYETLADLHEEDCLFPNPFYQEPPLDCWPCEDVKTLVDLSGLHNYSSAYVNNAKPFIVRDVMQSNFTVADMQAMYRENELTLQRETAKFSSSHRLLQNLSDILDDDIFSKLDPDFHVLWKINRVAAARIVRKIFQRPYFIPNTTEVSLQRFLFISGPDAPQFFFPLTEFANVWVAQGQGYRLVVLDPSEPCWQNCSTVSVLLGPLNVLCYNWQFWRPRSLPARLSEDISITYMGSFY